MNRTRLSLWFSPTAPLKVAYNLGMGFYGALSLWFSPTAPLKAVPLITLETMTAPLTVVFPHSPFEGKEQKYRFLRCASSLTVVFPHSPFEGMRYVAPPNCPYALTVVFPHSPFEGCAAGESATGTTTLSLWFSPTAPLRFRKHCFQ